VQYRERVAVLDTRSGKELRSQPLDSKTPGFLVRSGPGDLLCIDGELRDPTGATVTRLHEVEPGFLLGGAPSALAPDGRWAFGCSASPLRGSLAITDDKGKAVTLVDKAPIHAVAFSPDGTKLVYACGAGIDNARGRPMWCQLRVRDAATLELLEEKQLELGVWMRQWQFLDDQRALVAVDGKLQVWDVDKLEPVQTLLDAVGDFQLSDDRRTLAVQLAGAVQVHRVLRD
jgi:WD40 repeat protein